MPESLQISELFYSIQGESTWQGLPCVFLRLSGCNIRCRYCDAGYSWQEPPQKMSLAEVVAWTEQYPEILVEITGGEPLYQEAVYPLIQVLLDHGREILLETNGTLPLSRVPNAVHVIMDVKCPDSGMAAHFCQENLQILRERRCQGATDELKFVVSSASDFDWACILINTHQLEDLVPLLFSPVQPDFSPAKLAELMLARRIQARLQLQLHTHIWPDKNRGV